MNATPMLIGKLRPAVTAAGAMLAAAIFLAATTRHIAQTAADARDQALRARDRAAVELQQAESADAAGLAASELWQQLERDGAFAGDQLEQRQAQLLDSQHALRLPGMRPSFGNPAPWPGGDAGAYAWRATPLHLELELLHEGDLPDFLSRITQRSPLLVRECRLFRAVDDASPAPRLHADCELQWLSLHHASRS